MARVTLRITGIQLLCQDEHPSFLVALESHNVAAECQCREGYCGSCRIRLVAGQVDWIAESLAFIQPGEILLCCCRAEGDIEIEMRIGFNARYDVYTSYLAYNDYIAW